MARVLGAAAGRPVHPGEHVEAGGLAGAVRADQRVDGAGLDGERDGLQRGQAGEPHGDVPDGEPGDRRAHAVHLLNAGGAEAPPPGAPGTSPVAPR